MGMYTEFVFASELKKETPKEVIDILKYMVGDVEEYTCELPNNDLFKTRRWEFMLRCDSYYFDGKTSSIFVYDDIAKSYFITIRCNLKNYNSEIENFCDWISPYLKQYNNNFLGYHRYEEFNNPTLLYYVNGKVKEFYVNCVEDYF